VRRLLLIVLLIAGLCAPATPASRVLVLVVRSDSPVADLDSVTVRKLFLGVPVLINGNPLHPIRNRSADHLDEIFLQVIVGMSQSAYDRQILNGVNRQGWQRPAEASTLTRVLEDLDQDPQAVAFIWQGDIVHNSRVRVVRVLWSE
jgi:sulfur carrier protein ThiS